MARKIIQELKGMSESELREKVDNFRRELFGLRLNASTSHIKDYSQFKKLRKNVARGLTLLSKKTQLDLHVDNVDKE